MLGDGAAARRDGAPGYIDDRSFAYDDHVAAALAAGDADGLAALDVELGAELLATGRLTWPVAAAALRPETAELTWRGDPFGLSYFVALWRCRRALSRAASPKRAPARAGHQPDARRTPTTR